ncbi:MAG: hypothetical protein JXB30_08325, partial [Anaerolineae bacterium]|nr:hypothetical protein [Anaerolineae bacterium]
QPGSVDVLDNKTGNDWIIAWSLQQSVFQSSISNRQSHNNLIPCPPTPNPGTIPCECLMDNNKCLTNLANL